MSSVTQMNALIAQHGSPVLYHRDDSLVVCPCRTPEGFRDPIWHLENPTEPECNAAGFLPSGDTANFNVRAFVQPVQSGAVRRLTAESLINLFGEIQADDHLGIFPCMWDGKVVDFDEWGLSTEDWIEYNNRKYTVVSANLIPSPDPGGNPFHHWEVGLRLIEGRSG